MTRCASTTLACASGRVMSEAARGGNPVRPLTHPLATTREGLAVEATQRTCAVQNCTRPHYGRDLCKMHLQRYVADPFGQEALGVVAGPASARRRPGVPRPDCSVVGCGKPSEKRGWCATHHWRWKHHGDPHYVRTLDERLTDGLRQDPETGCWLWTRNLNSVGYGLITVSGQARLVHRVVYEHVVGPIPEGLQLDHLCRVRACANAIEHLDPVTAAVNRDRALPFIRRRERQPSS